PPAHATHAGRVPPRGERRHHRLDVLRAEPSSGETGKGGHRHVETGTGQKRRRLPHARVVLAVGGKPVNEDQRGAAIPAGSTIEIDAGALDGERLPGRGGGRGGGGGRRGEAGAPPAGQELQEKRARQQAGPRGLRDGDDQKKGEEESGEPGYFRLMHVTRRHPSNMLTRAIDSGTSPTCSSRGASGRFDFQPRRVQTGATRSSSQPIGRRLLRK